MGVVVVTTGGGRGTGFRMGDDEQDAAGAKGESGKHGTEYGEIGYDDTTGDATETAGVDTAPDDGEPDETDPGINPATDSADTRSDTTDRGSAG